MSIIRSLSKRVTQTIMFHHYGIGSPLVPFPTEQYIAKIEDTQWLVVSSFFFTAPAIYAYYNHLYYHSILLCPDIHHIRQLLEKSHLFMETKSRFGFCENIIRHVCLQWNILC